ncbi:MAG: AAA-like domain-containing protein [Anaerolineales bacterium]
MEELSQMDWPFFINGIGVLFTIIGVLIASAEFYLALSNRNRPQEEREGQGGLRTYNLLKNTLHTLRKTGRAISPGKVENGSQVFISYKRDVEPDEKLAQTLFKALVKRGHSPYIDKELTVGIEWSKEIHRQIKRSNFMVILLSKGAAASEMVAEELELAEKSRAETGYPIPLPVRVKFTETLPYHLQRYLGDLHYVLWTDEADDLHTQDALFKAIEGGLELPEKEVTKQAHADQRKPQIQIDPRLLEVPSGAVNIQSKFYINRECDVAIHRQLRNPGSTTTIRAGRQMGKTSLLVRAVHEAKQKDLRIVYLDFQQIHRTARSSLDHLLKYMSDEISQRLSPDPSKLEKIWASSRGAPDKFNQFMESVVLDEGCPFMLALDEADRLLDADFKTDFFALLRSWDSRRAYDPLWNCLHIAIVISTHPHLLIDDHMQSPFNVGLRLELDDFNHKQVEDLNQRYMQRKITPLKEEEIPGVMSLLGGHPYLTRQAFYTMIEKGLTWKQLEQIASSESGPFRSHLHFYLSQLAQQPKLLEGLREVIETSKVSDENVLYRLSAAGLVKEDSPNGVKMRCGLYEQYFKKTINA